MPRFSFQPLGDSWTLVAVLLAALVAGLVVFRPNDATFSRFRRRVAFGLRLALVTIFAVLFARPSVVSVEKEELPASFVFLCDLSESMSIRDETDGASRFETMKAGFAAVQDRLRDLSERFDVRVFGFGDATEELELVDGAVRFPDAPTGSETPLGAALAETLRTTAGSRTLGVAVVSDGTQRTKDAESPSPQDVALRWRDAERPIFAVPLGSAEGSPTTRDVAVLDLRSNDRVFLGNELTVSGQVRVLGLAGRKIPLALSLETSPGKLEVVDSTELAPTSNDATLSYRFVCAPKTAGQWKLRVAAPPQEGELADSNNELGAFVAAIDGGLDVLYIEGTRRYEQNFLRAALDEASDVRVRYWRPSTASLVARLPDATEAQRVAALTRSRKSLIETFFKPGQYAAYVLGDVDAAAFQPNELKALAELVESGTGLVVLAGERSLGAGGYAETPLADVFPVATQSADRLPLDSDLADFDAASPESQKLRFDGEFRAAPVVRSGRPDFVAQLNLDPKKNAESWAKLPPLSSVYRVGTPKPGATTALVASGSLSDGATSKELPLLVLNRFGDGRVATLATDSTWRWRMRGFEDEHRKFWRQLLLWTAKQDELLEGELAVELERSRFAPGENVDFRVVYRPKEGEDLSKLKAKATVVGPDGSRTDVALTDANGVWTGTYRGGETLGVGDYRVEASVLSSTGTPLQSAQARFLTFAQNLELDEPAASPSTLENLASTTDGKTLRVDDLASFLDELAQQRATVADFREVKRSLYDTWAIFALFAGLLIADWALRKRWGAA